MSHHGALRLDGGDGARHDRPRVESLPPVAEHFIEQWGLAVAAYGLPRTAGRIAALLEMVEEGCELEELARHLRVSRASVSTNTRLLESLAVIERYTSPGRRRMRYRVSPNRFVRVTELMLARMGQMLDLVRDTRTRLPASMARARKRLDQLAAYCEASAGANQVLLDRLRKQEQRAALVTRRTRSV